MAKYKQRCVLCRKNMVLISNYFQKPFCAQCQMRDFDKPIEDPKFRKMFDIDNRFYVENSFLRDIKSKYIRFGSLTDRQIEAFKRVAKDVSNPKIEPLPPVEPIAAQGAEPKSRIKKKRKKEAVTASPQQVEPNENPRKKKSPKSL